MAIRTVTRCCSSGSLSDAGSLASPRQVVPLQGTRSAMVRTYSRDHPGQASSRAQSPRDALACHPAHLARPHSRPAVAPYVSTPTSTYGLSKDISACQSEISNSSKHIAVFPTEAILSRPTVPANPSEPSGTQSPRAIDSPKVPTSESTGVPSSVECLVTPRTLPEVPIGACSAAVGRRFVVAAQAVEDSRRIANLTRPESPRNTKFASQPSIQSRRLSPRQRADVGSDLSAKPKAAPRGASPRLAVGDSSSKRQVGSTPRGMGHASEDAERQNAAWVPYARRKAGPGGDRCGSPENVAEVAEPRSPRSPKRCEPPRKRCEALYQDYEMRQRRWLEQSGDKKKHEEEQLRKKVQTTCKERDFNENAFLDWYNGRLGRYQDSVGARLQGQHSENQRRELEELEGCTFVPQTGKAPATSNCDNSRDWGCGGNPSTQAREVVFSQAVQLKALQQLDEQYEELLRASEQDAMMDLENAIEESRRKLQRFGETAEGRKYFKERAHSYIELNDGMSETVAMQEAQRDLVRATESKLRAQAAETLQQRQRQELHHIQMERLKVARELIQLQRRAQGLLTARAVQESALQDFDLELVDRITTEDWYVEAREAATRILKMT